MMIEYEGIKLYDAAELAEILKVKEATVREMLKRGDLKGKKIATKWYVSDIELKEYLTK